MHGADMSSTIILSLLGFAGMALLGSLFGGEAPAAASAAEGNGESETDDPTPAPKPYDPYELPPSGDTSIEDYAVYQGTNGNDDMHLSRTEETPIMAIGGAGADTFIAEFSEASDSGRAFDIIISDFDPEEDVLTFEVISEKSQTDADALQEIKIEPAEDGSHVDVRVSSFSPEEGPEAARDFVVRLDGLSDVPADCIYLAHPIPDEDETSEDDRTPPDADPAIVIEGDLDSLTERGTRGDDTIVVRHTSGKVVVGGGAGEDTIDASEFVRSDDASLRIDGSEGDDTYFFSQGINVSDDQYGGADVYSMTVNPETMHAQNPSTVVWDAADRFELNLPAELADQVRIENEPPHFDASLGATVQRDDVYVGDTLVMRLVNLDEEHRITLESDAFVIVTPSPTT